MSNSGTLRALQLGSEACRILDARSLSASPDPNGVGVSAPTLQFLAPDCRPPCRAAAGGALWTTVPAVSPFLITLCVIDLLWRLPLSRHALTKDDNRRFALVRAAAHSVR